MPKNKSPARKRYQRKKNKEQRKKKKFSQSCWATLSAMIKVFQTITEKTFVFSTMYGGGDSDESAEAETILPNMQAILFGLAISMLLVGGEYVVNTIIIGLNQDDDEEEDEVKPALAEEKLPALTMADTSPERESKRELGNNDERSDEEDSLLSDVERGERKLDDGEEKSEVSSDQACCDKFVAGITFREISMTLDCLGAVSVGHVLLSYAMAHVPSQSEKYRIKSIGVAIGCVKIYPDSRNFVRQLRKHGHWPAREYKRTNRPDSAAQVDGLTESFLVLPEQSGLVGSLIDMSLGTVTKAGFPTLFSLGVGAAICLPISAGEGLYHTIIDYVITQEDAIPVSEEESKQEYRPSTATIRYVLASHILTNVFVYSAFASWMHLLIANAAEHPVSIPENLSVKALGALMGATYTVGNTKSDITIFRRNNLWRAFDASDAATAVTGFLAMVGAGNIVIYWAPGWACAALPECGGVLSAVVPTVAPWIFSVVAAIDVAAVGVLFAVQAVPEFQDAFVKNPGSRAERMSIVMLVSATCFERLLVAIGTNAGPLLKVVIPLVAIPGAAWGSIKFIRVELPYLRELLKELAEYNRLNIKNIFCNLNPEQRRILRNLVAQHEMRDLLQEVLWQKMLTVLSQIKDIPYDENEHPLEFILRQKPYKEVCLEEWRARRCRTTGSKAVILSGRALAAVTVFPIVYNAYDKLPKHMPGNLLKGFFSISVFRVPMTGWLCLPHLYGIAKFGLDFVQSTVEIIKSLVKGTPIPSVALHLCPTMTVLMKLANAGISLFSYAVIAMLIINNFEEDTFRRLFLLWAASIGIVGIHSRSLDHLYDEYLSRRSKDERVRYMLEVQKVVEHTCERLTLRELTQMTTMFLTEEGQAEDKRTIVDFKLLEAPRRAFRKPAPAADASWSVWNMFARSKKPEQVGLVVRGSREPAGYGATAVVRRV